MPNADFYRIDTAIVVPRIDAAEWRLKVTGMVDREVEIDWKTLQGKQMQEALVTLTCVSNEVGGDLTGNAVWTGWPVRELLAMAGPKAGADMVLQTSVDGWTCGTPLARAHRRPQRPARDPDERRAAALRARLPRAARRARALRLRLRDEVGHRAQGDDLSRRTRATGLRAAGRAMGPVKTSSRIDVPRAGATVKAGTVAVAGVAWAQHRGISKVEVQVDQGRGPPRDSRSTRASTRGASGSTSGTRRPGSHDLRVRAYDASGEVQSPYEAPPAPDGATGIHVVNVRVE